MDTRDIKIKASEQLAKAVCLRARLAVVKAKTSESHSRYQQVIDAYAHADDLVNDLITIINKCEELIGTSNVEGSAVSLIRDYLSLWESGMELWSDILGAEQDWGEDIKTKAFNLAQHDVNGVRDHLKMFVYNEA